MNESINEIVHVKQYLDGFPLCWGFDEINRHATGKVKEVVTSSSKDEDVTCKDCLKYLEEV